MSEKRYLPKLGLLGAALLLGACIVIPTGPSVMVLPGTRLAQAAEDLGLRAANEIFADRAYNDDGTLVDRRLPGAMIRDPEAAAEAMAAMVREQAILSASGKWLPCRIDSICVHGDTPESVLMARAVRARLEAEGHQIAPLAGAG